MLFLSLTLLSLSLSLSSSSLSSLSLSAQMKHLSLITHLRTFHRWLPCYQIKAKRAASLVQTLPQSCLFCKRQSYKNKLRQPIQMQCWLRKINRKMSEFELVGRTEKRKDEDCGSSLFHGTQLGVGGNVSITEHMVNLLLFLLPYPPSSPHTLKSLPDGKWMCC